MQIARAPRKLFQEQVRPKRLNPNKGWILRIKALRTGTQFQILFPVRRCIDHMWFPTNVSGPIGTSDIDGDFLDLRRNGPCPLPPAWAKLRLPGESLSVLAFFPGCLQCLHLPAILFQPCNSGVNTLHCPKGVIMGQNWILQRFDDLPLDMTNYYQGPECSTHTHLLMLVIFWWFPWYSMIIT